MTAFDTLKAASKLLVIIFNLWRPVDFAQPRIVALRKYGGCLLYTSDAADE